MASGSDDDIVGYYCDPILKLPARQPNAGQKTKTKGFFSIFIISRFKIMQKLIESNMITLLKHILYIFFRSSAKNMENDILGYKKFARKE